MGMGGALAVRWMWGRVWGDEAGAHRAALAISTAFATCLLMIERRRALAAIARAEIWEKRVDDLGRRVQSLSNSDSSQCDGLRAELAVLRKELSGTYHNGQHARLFGCGARDS